MNRTELLMIARARRLSRSGEAKTLRLAAGLSIREVAGSIGSSPSAVWRWENGQRTPRGAPAAAWGELLQALDRVVTAV
jgi:transcriptional regulator with XRE-family HTH domain